MFCFVWDFGLGNWDEILAWFGLEVGIMIVILRRDVRSCGIGCQDQGLGVGGIK